MVNNQATDFAIMNSLKKKLNKKSFDDFLLIIEKNQKIK